MYYYIFIILIILILYIYKYYIYNINIINNIIIFKLIDYPMNFLLYSSSGKGSEAQRN